MLNVQSMCNTRLIMQMNESRYKEMVKFEEYVQKIRSKLTRYFF